MGSGDSDSSTNNLSNVLVKLDLLCSSCLYQPLCASRVFYPRPSFEGHCAPVYSSVLSILVIVPHSACEHSRACARSRVFVSLCVHMCLCVCGYARVCTCVSMCLCVHVCVLMSLCVSVYVCVCIFSSKV